MANISFYANEADWEVVVEWINAEAELAYIVRDGTHQWKAVLEMDAPSLFGKRLYLWHQGSGPLPLCLPKGQSGDDNFIENPFCGWTELRQGADTELPFFWPTQPGLFSLSLEPTTCYLMYPGKPVRQIPEPGTRVLGRSDFGWSGTSYNPRLETTRLWKKLKRFIHGMGVPVDGVGWRGPGSDPTPKEVSADFSFVALPGALAEMLNGTPWYLNPLSPERPAEILRREEFFRASALRTAK